MRELNLVEFNVGRMGALVSRTRKGAKAYVLRPFKRRGYFLTQEEYRERNPTLFDKIASGKYTEEAVEKMKLKRRDDFLALRRLPTVPIPLRLPSVRRRPMLCAGGSRVFVSGVCVR